MHINENTNAFNKKIGACVSLAFLLFVDRTLLTISNVALRTIYAIDKVHHNKHKSSSAPLHNLNKKQIHKINTQA